MGRIKDAFLIQSPQVQGNGGMSPRDTEGDTSTHLVVTSGGRPHESLAARAQMIQAAQSAAANRNLPHVTHTDANQIAGWNLLTTEARALVRQHREQTIGANLSPADLRNPEVQAAIRWMQESQRSPQPESRLPDRRAGVLGGIGRLGSLIGRLGRVLLPVPEGFRDYDRFYN